MNRKNKEQTIFKDILINGILIISSLRHFTGDIFSQNISLILKIVLWLFIISFVIFDLIPSLFSIKIKRERSIILPNKKKWLLYLTKNVEKKILYLYLSVLGIAIICSYYNYFPLALGYIYWTLFGAYFGMRITRYSKLYQDKYILKKNIPDTNVSEE